MKELSIDSFVVQYLSYMQVRKIQIQKKIINRSKIFDTVNKKKYNLCNIHFQGDAKKKLNRLFKYKISY